MFWRPSLVALSRLGLGHAVEELGWFDAPKFSLGSYCSMMFQVTWAHDINHFFHGTLERPFPPPEHLNGCTTIEKNLQSILKWPMSDVKALAGQLQLGFEVLLSGQFGDVRGPCWGDLVIVCNFWIFLDVHPAWWPILVTNTHTHQKLVCQELVASHLLKLVSPCHLRAPIYAD